MLPGKILLSLQRQFQWHSSRKSSWAPCSYFTLSSLRLRNDNTYHIVLSPFVLTPPARELFQMREELIYSLAHGTRYVLKGCLMSGWKDNG